MAVEKSAKRSKAKSRSEDTSMVVDEPAAPQEGSAKKHKKSKKADHSIETTVPPAVTDVLSPEKPKKKRKRDQPAPAEPSDATQRDEGQADAAANTTDAPRKKKRKHAKAEAEVSTEAADEEPRKRTKRKSGAPAEPHGELAPPVTTDEADGDGEDVGDKPKKKYPHPAKDESLSEQAVKALSYAYTYHKHRDVWKFSKAHQNWLIRHCWSTTEIPDDYIPLLKKYLKNLQGGARERLLETCQSILTAAEAPEEHEEAAAPAKDKAEPAAEGDAESPSKSVRFAAATKETDATTKTEVAAKKSTRPPESKVKRAKAFVKVLSS
ncbi:uncharacterized protein SCHCODRAFT_02576772 [Schizophyllum commune H4-8]|nr:uncharacterized protein SCHCODRAFT_02576772 [Schizophyllum commune H4-8]KAI5894116.1 hypothetical protein SCHCODRAFT_02576772 [Schizophyllum commune H4-8]